MLCHHADNVDDVTYSSSRFKWKIENVSKLNEENRFSPIFTIGPHKWRLLAFRRGCDMNGYLSLYVVAVECKNWRFAKFSVAVIDQTNDKNTLRKDTEDMFRFTEVESDWGFDEFIQLKELKDPSNGYIVNDACIVEVEFCLHTIKDLKEESMELMESVEKRDLVTMSIQQCDTHRKLDGKTNEQLADKVSATKVQERSFGVESMDSTSTLLASTSVCLDNNSAFICAFCQTCTVSKGSGSMLHIANGEEVVEEEIPRPNVVHVHQKCVKGAPRVYYVGNKVTNLELELARVSKIKCCCCGLKGAALGCFIRSCNNTYHVPCAFDTSGCRWDDIISMHLFMLIITPFFFLMSGD
ncbi:MATH domain and coiled-coil domain-containing protein At3g58340-like [Papaver somniferum]|uniref:MATH domain and coiled-coil domain-containing protein At3g58340-like n=1 Tax=Papaver somniferum TaxID=3469 RepID=UPI000E6FF628|nr:MATH domain and coiled-coil domain-containing protein At3g58340-like [Papaver somniferum]